VTLLRCTKTKLIAPLRYISIRQLLYRHYRPAFQYTYFNASMPRQLNCSVLSACPSQRTNCDDNCIAFGAERTPGPGAISVPGETER